VNGFIVCISKIPHTWCTKSITTVRRHKWAIYFYCCIRPKWLLCDAERGLLAMVEFLVTPHYQTFSAITALPNFMEFRNIC